jgi:hypothetical protein
MNRLGDVMLAADTLFQAESAPMRKPASLGRGMEPGVWTPDHDMLLEWYAPWGTVHASNLIMSVVRTVEKRGCITPPSDR